MRAPEMDSNVATPATVQAPPSPSTEAAAPAVPSPKTEGALRRAVEWFWRGQALRRLTVETPEPPAALLELSKRARLTARLGDRALRPEASFANGSGAALACDLYRQSVRWSLEALRATNAESPSDVGDLLSLSFVDFAELDAKRQADTATQLRAAARSLLKTLGARQAAFDRLRAQRTLRVGGVALVFAVIGVVILLSNTVLLDRRDLAQGRPWTASSLAAGLGCASPAQSCTNSPHFFFHTDKQENPWLEIDLGAAQRISALEVLNRTDCCTDRAIPLIVETSTNKKKWKEVAQRRDTFSAWAPSFSPVRARYLRLKVLGDSSMHLARVRVFD